MNQEPPIVQKLLQRKVTDSSDTSLDRTLVQHNTNYPHPKYLISFITVYQNSFKVEKICPKYYLCWFVFPISLLV